MTRRLVPALLLLAALPASAQVYAVETPYCGGRLVAERFETRVKPGPQGRFDYVVVIQNPGAAPVRFQVQVTGDLLGKPSGTRALARGSRTTLALGYTLPGRQPLRNEQLANVVRIGCP